MRHRPYLYQRGRMGWNERVDGGWMFLRPAPGPSLTVDGLRRDGIVKGYVEVPGRAIAGNYSLSFGQGLIFYDRLGEFSRSDWVQGGGPHPDLSGRRSAYLRGGVVEINQGFLTEDVFYSRQFLDLPVDPEGDGIGVPSATEEKIFGARIDARGETARLAVTALRTRFSNDVYSPDSPFREVPGFRGRHYDAWGADGALQGEEWRLAADAAFSSEEERHGRASAATLVRAEEDSRVWISLFDYDENYYAPRGKGPAFDASGSPDSTPSNQRGVSAGARREASWGFLEGEAALARFPSAIGNGTSEAPVFPSQASRRRLEGLWRPSPPWDISFRLQESARDRFAVPQGGSVRIPGEETVRRARLETSWQASPEIRLKGRIDERWEREPVTGRRADGKLVMGEACWSGGSPWSTTVRWYAFNSPTAFLTTGVEEVWDGVLSPQPSGGMGNLRGAMGERYALIARRRWGKIFRMWVKYDAVIRWLGAQTSDSRHAWHLQADYGW